jgi:hypothetical protein
MMIMRTRADNSVQERERQTGKLHASTHLLFIEIGIACSVHGSDEKPTEF